MIAGPIRPREQRFVAAAPDNLARLSIRMI